MKKIYYFTKLVFILFMLVFIYDLGNYYYCYNTLLENIEFVKSKIRKDLGITNELKEILKENDIYLKYQEDHAENGAIFSFTICHDYHKTLNQKDETIEILLYVILGY